MPERVLMLAWEYPPNHVGGLGRHVQHLAHALCRKGVDVTVVTRSSDGLSRALQDAGVKVIAAPSYALSPPDFLTWTAQFNVALLESVMRYTAPDAFDLVHAHDWMVAYAARALKHSWGVPLVATIHATEHGRQCGLHTPMQRHIGETEWWLSYEACRVIACSGYMKDEVTRVFQLPLDKVRVIPNGISSSWFDVEPNPSPEPTVLFVGRLVREKGPQVAVEAMSGVAAMFPRARLVLAGQGPMEPEIRRIVHRAGLGKVVELKGQVDDSGLRKLYSEAWVAVFPSSYEPFGIVALEAMATGVPCVVGDTGGLSEIVQNGHTGLKVKPGSVEALAGAVKYLLGDDPAKRSLASAAKEHALANYSWDDVAGKTLEVYKEALGTQAVSTHGVASDSG